MRPTHHYDQHGSLLFDKDKVDANGRKATIFWDEERSKWLLDFGRGDIAPLNLYHKQDLLLISHAK